MATPQATPQDPMEAAMSSMGSAMAQNAAPSPAKAAPSSDPMAAAFADIGQHIDPKTAPPMSQPPQTPGEQFSEDLANRFPSVPEVSANPLMAGAIKGVGETGHTLGAALNRAIGAVSGGVSNAPISWLPQSFEQPKELESANIGESIGKMGESLAEFALGEGAAKAPQAVSVAEKLGEVMKITELAKKSPMLTTLISLGLKAARGAAVGGVAGGLHGGAEGAEMGAALGAGGEVLGAARGAGKVAGKAEGAIESQVGKAVGESGIAEGVPASKTPPSGTPPSGEDIQPDLQNQIHSVSQNVGKENGITYQKPPTIRDAVGTTSREILKKSQADFKALDTASGGRWQRFADSIENIQKKMNEIAGIDDEAYEKLEVKRNEVQTLQAQLVEDLKSGGQVDPAIADRANAAYRKSMALSDLNDAVRASTKRVASGDKVIEAVDPVAFSNKLSKLSDIPMRGGESRLETAVGTKGAQQLRDATDAAHIATQKIKDFVPTPGMETEATGKQALETMVRNATNIKKFGGAATDWNAVRNQFERLKPEAQRQIFGNDVERLRLYLNQQATKQAAIGLLKKGGIALASGGLAAAGYTAAREVLH